MSSASEALRDPLVELSVAWTAAQKVLGLTLPAWEPDTIRIELERAKIPPTDELMAKLLGAQTVVTGPVWTYDHDVLFALALACDGLSASAEAIHHPTPEQLCWVVRELEALTDHNFSDEDGFDPDTIDPAIAAVLHEEGVAVAPKELAFAQPALDHFLQSEKDLPARVAKAWKSVEKMPSEDLRRTLREAPKSSLDVQVHRLIECRLYVIERSDRRSRQNASLRHSI
jgi:hypothetical protein